MRPYTGQILMFAGESAPDGYLACDGSLQAISEYGALFQLLGVTYGGDGQTTFALPDLRGRVALGQGRGPGLSPYNLGQSGGVENVILHTPQLPSHAHATPTTGQPATTNTPAHGVAFADQAPSGGSVKMYTTTPNSPTALVSQTVKTTGLSVAHENRQPVLAISYCIATQGMDPSGN